MYHSYSIEHYWTIGLYVVRKLFRTVPWSTQTNIFLTPSDQNIS